MNFKIVCEQYDWSEENDEYFETEEAAERVLWRLNENTTRHDAQERFWLEEV